MGRGALYDSRMRAGSGARRDLLGETMCILARWKEGHSCFCVMCAGRRWGVLAVASGLGISRREVPISPTSLLSCHGAAVQPSDAME